mmetsp:Transcript_21940/g.36740  ORF Transcript_21940/g.36740 Transcript_21940/m.36740 type:complete len:237 (-) Transcript_21940:460-1170(-)
MLASLSIRVRTVVVRSREAEQVGGNVLLVVPEFRGAKKALYVVHRHRVRARGVSFLFLLTPHGEYAIVHDPQHQVTPGVIQRLHSGPGVRRDVVLFDVVRGIAPVVGGGCAPPAHHVVVSIERDCCNVPPPQLHARQRRVDCTRGGVESGERGQRVVRRIVAADEVQRVSVRKCSTIRGSSRPVERVGPGVRGWIVALYGRDQVVFHSTSSRHEQVLSNFGSHVTIARGRCVLTVS